MLNFALCDDNLTFLNKMSYMLENIFIKHDYKARIAFKSNNAKDLLDFVQNNHIDVLILDINLNSNMNGLDLAEKIRAINKDLYLIFTTGHLEFAMLAYKVKTFDYIAKPVTKERLEFMLNRLFSDIENSTKKFISINQKLFINLNEILFIKKEGMRLIYHTINNEYTVYDSLNRLEEFLPNFFVRCHKSYIVNVNNINYIESSTDTIVFNNNKKCFIGIKYKKNLMEVINCGNYTDHMDIAYNTK